MRFLAAPLLAFILTLSVPLWSADSPGLPPRSDAVATDLATAHDLLDRSLDWRGRAVRYVDEVGGKVEGGTLSSGDLERLYTGGEDYVFLNRRWQAIIDLQGEEAWKRASPTLANNPLARTQTKLVLAASLMQHDDFALGVEPYFKLPKLRRLLKSDHPAIEGELDAAARRFLDPVRRLRLARAVVWHRAEGGKAADRTPAEVFLDDIITQSPGYAFYCKDLPDRLVKEWATGGHAAVTFVTDLLDRTGREVSNVASMAVGNTLGLVETRSGYLTQLASEAKDRLRSRLRPLDVLLEKTPFRLTDKSIPGHYGHVAVWVGTEAELKALGLWEDPLVKPHWERIRQGACIVEALRPGVEINTLDHFLNIDDLLVIRHRSLATPDTVKNLRRAFAQIGKEYDFNFDVESDRRIVCSELAYVVFPEIPWPTSKTLGRQCISPDQVAIRAMEGGPFAPQIIFHDGVEIGDKLPETLASLLKEDTKALRSLHPGFVGKSEKR